jgi:hypothetical protein
MSARRTILRELSRTSAAGSVVRPATISGFDANPARFQAAVNALLQERLINGTKDTEGRLAIGLNEQRLADVRKELRPVWAHPVLWLALVVVAVGAVALLA